MKLAKKTGAIVKYTLTCMNLCYCNWFNKKLTGQKPNRIRLEMRARLGECGEEEGKNQESPATCREQQMNMTC